MLPTGRSPWSTLAVPYLYARSKIQIWVQARSPFPCDEILSNVAVRVPAWIMRKGNVIRNPNPKPVGQNPSSNLAYPCARCGSNIAKCKGSGLAAATADSHIAATAPTPVCSRPKERLECKPNPPNRGTKPWQTSSRPHRVLLNFISRTRHLWKTILKSSMPPAGDFRWPTVGPF